MKQLRENELLKDDYTRLGGGILGEQEYGEDVSDESMERLLHYNYFNGEKIRASLNLKPQVEKEGQKNREQKAVELVRVSAGYSNHGEEQIGQAEGRGKTEGKGKAAVRTFPIKLLYTRDKILRAECSCDQCMRTYARYMGNCRCGYVAAMAQMLEEYLKDHPVGDATDMSGRLLLSSFQEKRQNQAETAAARGEILTLAPRLTQKGGELSISFRVGAGRMFVVKDLEAFCGYVKESATAVYGTNTELNHSIENFREESKKWIRYISRIVREEEQFSQRLEESRYYYRQPAAIGGSLKLFGWRLDQFFELLGEDPVEFENKDLAQKGKRFLRTETQNPKVTMEISEQKMRGEREFHGIWVRGTLPELHFGMDTAYYIEEDCLCKVEPEFLKKIEALANLSQQNHFSFRVGRNSLAEFYYRVLPQLEGAVEITETDPKRFRAYLPPQARFVFYLDAEEDDLMCRIRVRYGDREFSALDLARAGQERSASIEPFRDGEREREILSGCAHVAGRTRFDREGTLAINPDLTWHRLNETMRACFYEGRWDRKSCRSFEIFVSQGDYPLKGFHYLLLAMEEILREFPQAHIRVAGIRITGYDTLKEKLKISGYGNYLRKLMKEKGLTEKVTVLGNLTDTQMKEAYLNSHVFVCPSSLENSPNSLGEAMLLGVPCVASLTGGIPDMAEDGRSALFFKKGNVHELAGCICRIFRNDGLAESLSGQARIRGRQNHDGDANYARMLEIYREILG